MVALLNLGYFGVEFAVVSPCKDICRLGTYANVGTGCGRTLGEIAEWGSATASRQHEIVRRSATAKPRPPLRWRQSPRRRCAP